MIRKGLAAVALAAVASSSFANQTNGTPSDTFSFLDLSGGFTSAVAGSSVSGIATFLDEVVNRRGSNFYLISTDLQPSE
jgi:hypothetical protein